MVNVAVYCRVSTEEQAKFGISVNDQKDSLTKYCKDNKYKIYDYYIDEGVSAGTISKRKEFVRLLQDLDKIDLILFTKLDRFSRSVRDANNLLEELEKHKVSFRAIDEDDIDTSTSDGRFIFNLKVNLAEHERGKDSERIKRVFDYKYNVSKTVCSGAKIFGYDVINKKYVVNEEEKEIIIDLYKHYLDSVSLVDTTKWFNQKYNTNYITKTIKFRLTDKKYIGIFQKYRSDIIVKDYIPRILDDELFYNVQKKLNFNQKVYSNTKKYTFIFSTLTVCGSCGHKLNWEKNTYCNYKFSRCRYYHESRICTNSKMLSEKKLEQYLLDNFASLVEKKELEVKKKTIKIKNKSKEIKTKLDKLVDLYINDIIPKDKYEKEYSTLSIQYKEELKKESIPVIQSDLSQVKELINKNFEEIYLTFNDEEKKEFWNKIIDKIYIENGTVKDVIFL